MAVTLADAAELLREHHLLREIIAGDLWTLDARRLGERADQPFAAVTYDTRAIEPGTLLFCKGSFRASYLSGADERGLAAYVAETPYDDVTAAPGLIVNDVRRAMSLLAAAFYGNPQERLTLIGITGTKGKTTTAYFTQAILNAYSGGKAALFSSVCNCLDGRTYEPSDLTTPESLDALRMMHEAVGNGMRYLVMEVSSQAYKVERVYGLTFDVGAFLNISPDHISPIEHPTFEDYFHCKRQLVHHSRALVLDADCAHADLIREVAAADGVPVTTFALHDAAGTGDAETPADVTAAPAGPNGEADPFVVSHDGGTTPFARIHLAMQGEFNYANAAAAATLAHLAGVPWDDAAMTAVDAVTIPGRMERVVSSDGIVAYVDFAHNYLSVTALLDEMRRLYADRNPRITLVAGSTGGKALDRREGIATAADGRVDRAIFTTDDPDREDPRAIAEQMASYVHDPRTHVDVIVPRDEAVEAAVTGAREHADRFNVILLIGKGNETRNKIDGRPVHYDGDRTVVERAFAGARG
ncbi:UDP-N-acetylmuramoylalanyl-D-glutamate--2, 6-diaminopimelate ligase [Bifidobacterium sp. DSM 109958]|uniref:UDP-N-acetylmuramyl-tripeptide synthetase n=1 Tax=Bifidobacterium moraviense TaxID=2675323 RepID=A0A7Y0HXP2_9BIFI|nr:UDP-N-acetylmuramoyl-L-alanyl-D-glutamate--2,6-diaminopimelate ligase [Bifidobacterium sp. DSM 109958]NMN00441.1 UDP-N-acetylmuramoylalanyl-D-glutamate--2, 6-diaminopimelate ligase [Bifidobacterium sp. DSM 109958]